MPGAQFRCPPGFSGSGAVLARPGRWRRESRAERGDIYFDPETNFETTVQ